MPKVSVITATYNRSGPLRLAMDTALRQTHRDLELLVIGDACTDDTEEVVERVDDARIRWVNLPRNCGDQSGPNNAGVERATGDLIAFLNHDDLWFADHLERCISALERTGADLVFAFGAKLLPDGTLDPVAPSLDGTYARHMSVPASTWVMRRELADAVGPWRPATELWIAPSQDWLARAAVQGARLRQSAALTVLMVPSGYRPGSYLERGANAEHLAAHAAVTGDPQYRTAIATELAVRYAAMRAAPRTVWQNLRTAARDVYLRTAVRSGTDPAVWRSALQYRRRGGYIARLRETRGLEPR